MYSRTSAYQRLDGTRGRAYVCKNVVEQTGACDAPPVDAEAADASLLPHLQHFFLDYVAFNERAREATGRQRAALDRELERHRDRLARKSRAIENAEARYEAAMEAGDDSRAERIEDQLTRWSSERQAIQADIDAALARRTQLADEAAPTDALRSYWRTLAEGIAGRLEAS